MACSADEVLTASCKCMKLGIVTHPDKIYMNFTETQRLICYVI